MYIEITIYNIRIVSFQNCNVQLIYSYFSKVNHPILPRQMRFNLFKYVHGLTHQNVEKNFIRNSFKVFLATHDEGHSHLLQILFALPEK